MIIGTETTQTEGEFSEITLKSPMASLTNFKNYYEEQFGMKSTMVNAYINLKTEVLNENPIQNRVVKGSDGWYFLGNHYNNLIDDYFGNAPFTTAELVIITRNIKDINAYLQSKNIRFYIVVPPNKISIYHDKFPYSLTKSTTRLEALKAHLKDELNFEIIDLKQPLLEHKDTKQLYHKINTHWNDYGAYLGYQATINVLNRDFDITLSPISDYTVKNDFIDGDITAMIKNFELEPAQFFHKKDTASITSVKNTYEHLHYINASRKLKLFMHRDSFSNNWTNFFNSSFGETVYLRSYTLNKALIEKEQPDIVIFEIVERNINILLKK